VTPLVERARELAREAHEGQLRKAGRVPYFAHLEAVATIVAAHGHDDEVTVAAAYLHDLIEDQPTHAPRLRAEMPREVVEVVQVLTEPKRDDEGRRRDKAQRFDDYVGQLSAPTPAAATAIPISCADKIHNLRSIVETEARGESLLGRLSTRPGDHRTQLARLRPIYARGASARLLDAFDAEAEALMETIARWLPGRAVALAAEAHLGQFDKAGAPYIEHPMRLMLRADGAHEKMVAVLHDVVEDSAWTLDGLRREGFGEPVLGALDRLTRRANESYDAFIARVAEDPLATRVKLLDLEDNADLSRIEAPTERDRARVDRYRRAIQRLRGT